MQLLKYNIQVIMIGYLTLPFHRMAYMILVLLTLLKNPIILLTIWKILGIAALIILVFSFLIEVFDGNAAGWFINYLLTPEVLIIPGILFGLSMIAYLIVAVIYGWKYIVLFEMDDNGVEHIQMQKQFKKAEGLTWLVAMAGLAAGNFTTAGAGMLAGSKKVSRTNFADVKKVKRKSRFHCIMLNEIIERNQLYVDDTDIEFVWNFVRKKCINASFSI